MYKIHHWKARKALTKNMSLEHSVKKCTLLLKLGWCSSIAQEPQQLAKPRILKHISKVS
jgi:hypothetical protein